jgi:hypothetical protein
MPSPSPSDATIAGTAHQRRRRDTETILKSAPKPPSSLRISLRGFQGSGLRNWDSSAVLKLTASAQGPSSEAGNLRTSKRLESPPIAHFPEFSRRAEKTERQARANARKCYEALLRLLQRVVLNAEQGEAIGSKLAALKARLEAVGERF